MKALQTSIIIKLLTILFVGSSIVTAWGASWPAKVFAPYMYIGAGDHFQITQCDDACGQKFYTIAFIIADQQHNPAWDGRFPLASNLYAGQISEIRRRGGDVIVSFGGGGGTELALVETNTAALEAKYQAVIDRYQLTWLDFDIEGSAMAKQEVNQRRNEALAWLQAKNPGLIISYTVPVDPDGIPDSALKMLADAKSKGVKVYSVNVMTMDYGKRFSEGKKMSDVSIASALKAYEQCQTIDPAMQIGLTPMIGNNDQKGEVFTQDDAKALFDWAKTKPWICSLSFWASNRDNGKHTNRQDNNAASGIKQEPWDFTRIFQPFTTVPKFKVIAFYTGKDDLAHISFVHEANRWFPKIAEQYHFSYEATTNWNDLNTNFLSQYQVVLFLDTRPEAPTQRDAFQHYMENGGAWMGFHFSAFALTPSAYPQNWDWYHEHFLGSGEYVSNTWRPTSAVLKVEDANHPATSHLPATFNSSPNEWYRWKNDLRTNADIKILLSIAPSSFPLGTGPKPYEIWHSGYYPVVWTNTKYKMMYLNMGHNDMDYEHHTNKELSFTLTNQIQDKLIIDGLLWLGSDSQWKKSHGNSVTKR